MHEQNDWSESKQKYSSFSYMCVIFLEVINTFTSHSSLKSLYPASLYRSCNLKIRWLNIGTCLGSHFVAVGFLISSVLWVEFSWVPESWVHPIEYAHSCSVICLVWFISKASSGLIQCVIQALQGLYLLRRRCLISIGIPIINLRRLSDHLRFIMGIPIHVRWHLCNK